MNDHLRLRKKALELFATGERLARSLKEEQMLTRLQEARERIDTRKRYLVVVADDKRCSYIPKPDAVLFVTDAGRGGVAERECLKRGDRHCKHVLFIVTKMDGDGGRKAGPVIGENRAELATIFGKPADSLKIIPTS